MPPPFPVETPTATSASLQFHRALDRSLSVREAGNVFLAGACRMFHAAADILLPATARLRLRSHFARGVAVRPRRFAPSLLLLPSRLVVRSGSLLRAVIAILLLSVPNLYSAAQGPSSRPPLPDAPGFSPAQNPPEETQPALIGPSPTPSAQTTGQANSSQSSTSQSSTSQASTGTATTSPVSAALAGTVHDANGGGIANAQISLRGQQQPDERTARSTSDGSFSLNDLPPDRYSMTIVAPGFETYLLPELLLHAGQQRILPTISLPVADVRTSIQVTASDQQIAQAEVHAAEKQRVFGILPNFYTSYTWQAAPLNPRQKFELASHSIFDPVAFLSTAAIAGVEQYRNTFPGYGDDAAGFGKRYAAAYGDEAIGRLFTSAVYPVLFHQDPRYFYRGTGSNASRARYAILQVFVTRGNDRRNQPNYSLFLGRLTAGALANAYHPHADRGVSLTVTNALLNIGGHAVDNLLREFFLRRFTPSVPAFAQGKAATTQP